MDKLESIPGFQTLLTEDKIKAILKEVGAVMMGQTDDIVLADRKMYQLRDVTATVDSIDLISASIMSKKLAEGMDALVLDIKTGNGAFMQKIEDAIALAKSMIEIGTSFKKDVFAYITDMNQPLGNCIGNSLEMIQTIELLKGEERLNIDYKDMAETNGSADFFKNNAIGIGNEGPVDFLKLTLVLSAKMLLMSKVVKTFEEGLALAHKMIDSGKALEKLEQIIIAQNGNPKVIDNYALFKQAEIKEDYILNSTGYITKMNTYKIGMGALMLGAGRENINSLIDPSAGFIFHKKLNDYVDKNEVLLTIYANDKLRLEKAKKELNEAFEMSDKPIVVQPLIYGSVTTEGYKEHSIAR